MAANVESRMESERKKEENSRRSDLPTTRSQFIQFRNPAHSLEMNNCLGMLCLSFRGQIKCKFLDSNGLWTNVANSTHTPRERESPFVFARAICTLSENVWISLIRYFHYRHLHTLAHHHQRTKVSLSRAGFVAHTKTCSFSSRSSFVHPHSFCCPRKSKESSSAIPSAWKCNYFIREWGFRIWCGNVGSIQKTARDHMYTILIVAKTLFALAAATIIIVVIVAASQIREVAIGWRSEWLETMCSVAFVSQCN